MALLPFYVEVIDMYLQRLKLPLHHVVLSILRVTAKIGSLESDQIAKTVDERYHV